MQYQGTIRRSLRGVAIAACAIVLTMSARQAVAQISTYGAKGLPAMTSAMSSAGGQTDTTPEILKKVGIDQHLNYQLPLDLTFTDDHGNLVPLSRYFGKVPAIFLLVYYRCPMLCSEELEGLTSALKMISFRPGKDFNIIVISIDPTETTAMAAAKKAEYLKMYGHPETADGWHFMTGTQANIDTITNVVGFKYVKLKVPGTNITQFAHASALEIVTPQGKLAQYYMGVEYSPKDMLLGLDEASNDKIGSPVDNILTYCYHYDPLTNTHDLIVSRVVQLGGILTILILGGFMLVMFRKDYGQGRHPVGMAMQGTAKKVNG
ncbi:MAG TPA: SCO family protein [Terracidiphilus sp.]|nr:SCO family protein [Terracidiphilus sp.]